MDVVDLNPDHIPAAGAVLARALFEDGLAKHMCADEEERKALTPWHFSAMVRYGVLFGQVLTTAGEPHGIAIWLAPGETAMTDNRIAAAGLDASPAMPGDAAFGLFMGAMAEIEPYREQDIAPRHWYLALVGVDPDYGGKGIGNALLRPILKEADSQGLPCYLETAEERNVAFYQKHGFETVRHGVLHPDKRGSGKSGGTLGSTEVIEEYWRQHGYHQLYNIYSNWRTSRLDSWQHS